MIWELGRGGGPVWKKVEVWGRFDADLEDAQKGDEAVAPFGEHLHVAGQASVVLVDRIYVPDGFRSEKPESLAVGMREETGISDEG